MISKKGFTLIELLVVIAIIGILASIVLVSLSGARNRARDARISAALAQVRAVAEIFYNDNDYVYTGLCADAQMVILMGDMDIQSTGTSVCFAGGVGTEDDYCVSSPMTTAGVNSCVSPAGVVGDDACLAVDTPCN